jgi:hypothetical protein
MDMFLVTGGKTFMKYKRCRSHISEAKGHSNERHPSFYFAREAINTPSSYS